MDKRICLAVVAGLLGPGAAGAQPVFKCLDGKSVTYSNTPCDKLGLKSAGEVADRVTTFQSPAPVPAAPGARKPPATAPGNEVDAPNPAATRPVSPLIEKLAK
jgi:hypothetical protein